MHTQTVAPQGRFLVLEGLDGSGKTSQLNAIKSYLEDKKKKVILTKEPGATKVGQYIMELLRNESWNTTPYTDMFLLFADRIQHIHEVILPALQEGMWVVSDRFVDSTYAYQGGGFGIDIEVIQQVETLAYGKFQPDLVFLLDIHPDTVIKRLKHRNKLSDKYEQQTKEFFTRVCSIYRYRAKHSYTRHVVLNAECPLIDVRAELLRHISLLLP